MSVEEVHFHSFLTSALDRSEWSASHPGHLPHKKRLVGNHRKGEQVGVRTHFTILEKIHCFFPARILLNAKQQEKSAVQLHCTPYAVLGSAVHCTLHIGYYSAVQCTLNTIYCSAVLYTICSTVFSSKMYSVHYTQYTVQLYSVHYTQCIVQPYSVHYTQHAVQLY
jgi:hypothetical protein